MHLVSYMCLLLCPSSLRAHVHGRVAVLLASGALLDGLLLQEHAADLALHDRPLQDLRRAGALLVVALQQLLDQPPQLVRVVPDLPMVIFELLMN